MVLNRVGTSILGYLSRTFYQNPNGKSKDIHSLGQLYQAPPHKSVASWYAKSTTPMIIPEDITTCQRHEQLHTRNGTQKHVGRNFSRVDVLPC